MASISNIIKGYAKFALLLFALPAGAQVIVSPLLQPHQAFFNPNTGGAPCSGCFLYSYAAGTTTPLPTYTDSTGTTQNTNPIVLDAGGMANIWTSPVSYKFLLQDANSATLWTVDNVNGAGGGGGIAIPNPPAFSIQAANSTATGLTSNPNITINTDGSSPSLQVGTPSGHTVHVGFAGSPPADWYWYWDTPQTACASIGCTNTNYRAPGLITFGDSICVGTGATDPSDQFVTRLAVQLGGAVQNYCVSGYQIQSEPGEMYLNSGSPAQTSAPAATTEANNPLSLEEGGKNDATLCTTSTVCYLNSQLSLQTIITHRGSNNVVPTSLATQSGTWATDSLNTTALSSTTNGSTLTFSVVTYSANQGIGVPYRVWTSNGGTASVTIDGVAQPTGLVAAGNGGPVNLASTYYYVFTQLYPVASAGVHSVVITVTSSTSGSNVVSIPDVTGPPNPATYYANPQLGVMEVIPYENNSVYNNAWTVLVNTMKQTTVTALAAYGYNVTWLPVTNVPCANGTANCTGGFNPTNYISNQPGVFDPDGLSCAGSQTDTVHPNDCGQKQMAQALQTDLRLPYVGSSGGGLPQNIYTSSHTIVPGVDGILYMGTGTTVTLPLTGISGFYLIYADCTAGQTGVTITAASGTSTVSTVPQALACAQHSFLFNYGPNWFGWPSNDMLNLNAVIETANSVIVPYNTTYFLSNASNGQTFQFTSTVGPGPFLIDVNGAGSWTATASSGLSFALNSPTTLVAGGVYIATFYGTTWNIYPVSAAALANNWTTLQNFSNGINMPGTTSPIELNGSAGTSTNCMLSAGAGATPTWGACPTGSSGLSGMTATQVPIAATATTITSSKALAGAGAGITTGPASGVTSLDVMESTGTGGQIADSGVPVANVLLTGTRLLTGYSPGTANGGSAGTISIGLLGGSSGNFTQGATNSAMPLMPFAGTISGLYFSCGTTGKDGTDGVVTVLKQVAGNGSQATTTMTVTYGTTTHDVVLSDTTHTVSFAAGDRIGLRIVVEASTTLASCAATLTY